MFAKDESTICDEIISLAGACACKLAAGVDRNGQLLPYAYLVA